MHRKRPDEKSEPLSRPSRRKKRQDQLHKYARPWDPGLRFGYGERRARRAGDGASAEFPFSGSTVPGLCRDDSMPASAIDICIPNSKRTPPPLVEKLETGASVIYHRGRLSRLQQLPFRPPRIPTFCLIEARKESSDEEGPVITQGKKPCASFAGRSPFFFFFFFFFFLPPPQIRNEI
jgi:hypothetical protein